MFDKSFIGNEMISIGMTFKAHPIKVIAFMIDRSKGFRQREKSFIDDLFIDV